MKTSIEIKTVLNGTLLDFDAITPNNDKFD